MNKKLIGLLLIVLCTVGCWKTVQSDVLYEKAVVKQLVYVPKSSGHGMSTGIGMTTNGGMAMTTSPIHVTIPETYMIVFKCEHGLFPYKGSLVKAMYADLNEGDVVTIAYREVYREYGDGERKLVDLDLISIEKEM